MVSTIECLLWKIAAQLSGQEAVNAVDAELSREGQPARVTFVRPAAPGPPRAWIGIDRWRWAEAHGLPRELCPPSALEGGALVLDVGEGSFALIAPMSPERAGSLALVLLEVLTHIARSDRARGPSLAEQSASARIRRYAASEPIIGQAGGLAPVFKRVDMAAPQDVPVLLLGETGTGKEVVARAVHERSRRARGPFVRVNCGAIPRDLIDSELFGHEKGSFTGASSRRQGWFERADGGTLLLDEIGELPLEAQVRLLRILQDGTFTRVGGTDTVGVDVRIVAATHRDLPVMVDRRAFREDLWYRIATFPIRIPPLRERQDDIPELARHFIRKAGVRFGLPEPTLDADSLDAMRAYAWPGNVRELGAVIDRAMILGEGQRLEVAGALGLNPGRAPRVEGATIPEARRPDDHSAPLDDAMRHHIESVLRQTRGRVDGPHGAAIILRINPNTLRSRMRKLRIDRKRFRLP